MFGQLNSVHPLRDCQLPGLSEEGGQPSDRLQLVHVFSSNSRHYAASALPARAKKVTSEMVCYSVDPETPTKPCKSRGSKSARSL